MTIEEELEDLGVRPEMIAKVAAVVRRGAAEAARVELCEFIARLMVRLDRNSAHGRAVATALGYDGGMSLELAAREFGVKKQYLHEQQKEVERKLAGIACELRKSA